MEITPGGSSCQLFPDRFGIWNVGLCKERRTLGPGEKPIGARTKTNNKLNPHLQ